MSEKLKEYHKNLKDKSPVEVIRWAYETYGNKLTFASSFGAEDVVLCHMISEISKEIEVFFLDTGRLHQETYKTVEHIKNKYNFPIKTYFPSNEQVEEMVNEYGPNHFFNSVESRKQCCQIRKIGPLKRALNSKDAWITGLRSAQSVTRTDMAVIEWDSSGKGLYKLNPLIHWTEKDVWNYIEANKVPFNELHKKGFPSIGCAPCTRPIQPGEDVRAGRWWWENENVRECGLHR